MSAAALQEEEDMSDSNAAHVSVTCVSLSRFRSGVHLCSV